MFVEGGIIRGIKQYMFENNYKSTYDEYLLYILNHIDDVKLMKYAQKYSIPLDNMHELNQSYTYYLCCKLDNN